MRKYYTVIGLCLFSTGLVAGVHTVSNDPAKPAQFTSPAAALAAASPGDTLYIYGSPNDYGDFIIDKSITIIGAGFNTRKENFYKTKFNNLFLGSGTLSNITIDGVVGVNFYLPAGGIYHYSNITLRNSIYNGGIGGLGGNSAGCGSTFTNWLIDNCYFGGMNMAGNISCNPVSPVTGGFLVKNSIISQLGGGIHNYSITFTNCQLGVDATTNSFARNWNCTFNNCIFYRMSFTQWSFNANNQFNNCLTFDTQSPSQTFDLNNWTGGGSGTANNCIINQNPLWVTTPSATFFNISAPSIPNVWNPAIQAGSPAINAGSDGTDIGLTGGSVPYNYLAEPKIPVIRRYQLVNAVVPPNGTVTVNVTATKAQ
jgi:hypothetical protein